MMTLFREVLPNVRIATRTEPSGWSFNTILLSIGDSLAVYSPTRKLGDDAHVRIREIGNPRHLIAPNHFHHLGLNEWKERYPDAAVFARSQALPRLTKMYPSLGIRPMEELDLSLTAAVSWIEPRGTKNGEVWLRTQDAWIVGDAFSNVPAVRGVTGLVLRLTNAAPGLKISRIWAPIHLADPAEYKSWLLEELGSRPPAWLIPAHGDPISGPDLSDRLRALAGGP